MSSPSTSPISRLWQKWKSLKFPWRRRWLAGTDLAGNKYWYFKPSLSTPRARRILQNNPKIPYSDIQIPPQWHQWLRHTRPSAPTLNEQTLDLERLRQLKRLAQAADERWAAKPSVLDSPRRGNMELGVGDGEGGRRREAGQETGAGERVEKERSEGEKREGNPWKRDRGSPGQGFQPEAWTPGAVRR